MHPTVAKIQEFEDRKKTEAFYDQVIARLDAIEAKTDWLMQAAGLVEATKKPAK